MNEPWPHGDVSDAELMELGLDPAACVDFAVNVDPQGPAPVIRQAITDAGVARYPDPTNRQLVAALADRDGVRADRVLVGAGVTGLLWDVFRSVPHETRVLVPQHTFAEYAAAAKAHRLTVDELPRTEASGWSFDWDRAHAWLRGEGPRVLVLGSPDNPTGRLADLRQLHSLASAHPNRWIVIDEAFVRLSVRPEQALDPLPDNVIRLRSLTKELAIPGLRVGYLVAGPSIVRAIDAVAAPWRVSAVAHAAAFAGVTNRRIAEDARLRMRADVQALTRALTQIGLAPYPTQTVYLLVRVEHATELTRWCRTRRILVRDCSSFGLPHHIRLVGRPAADRTRLTTALTEYLR